MKKILILILSAYSINIYSQAKIYFDENWEKTEQSNASYYRISKEIENDYYLITDYYINGQIQMEAFSHLPDSVVYTGKAIWYDTLGRKETVRFYVDNLLDGKSTHYFYNPLDSLVGFYINNKAVQGYVKYYNSYHLNRFDYYEKYQLISKITFYKNSTIKRSETIYYINYDNEFVSSCLNVDRINYYDKKGKNIGSLEYEKTNSNYIKNGTMISYFSPIVSEEIESIIPYENGSRNGIAKYYNKEGKLLYKGVYKDGEHWSGDFLERNKKTSYKKGIKIGEEIFFDNDYNILSSCLYQDGKIYSGVESHNNYEFYYDKGVKVKEIKYVDDSRKIKSIRYLNSNNYTNETYSDDGLKLIATCEYRNGNPYQGLILGYGKNTYYKDGLKTLEEEFFENDKLQKKTFFKNDSITHSISYHPISGVEFHCQYKNNRAFNGVESDYSIIKYYDNRQVYKRINFEYLYDDKEYQLKQISYNDGYNVTRLENYVDDKLYAIDYKNNVPYEGALVAHDGITNYKNGVKEGNYTQKLFSNRYESGIYINDLRQGEVIYIDKDSLKYSCIYKDDFPVTGTVLTESEIINYKDGKKHGLYILEKYDYSYSLEYVNGKKEGNYILNYNDSVYQCSFKNDMPFNGSYLNTKFNFLENYKDGRKDGLFEYKNPNFYYKYKTLYKNGEIKEVSVENMTNNEVIAFLEFKDDKAFKGDSIRLFDYEFKEIIPYENGNIEGLKETYVIGNEAEFDLIESVFYENGIKNGKCFYLINIYNEDDKLIEGIYKNDIPFEGDFLNRVNDLSIVSSYQNGIKNGQEIYYYDRRKYVLNYVNGEIIEGEKLEIDYNDEALNDSIFVFKYENGNVVNILANISYKEYEIEYTDNGLDFKSNMFDVRIITDEQGNGSMVFDNKDKLIGELSVLKNTIKQGELYIDLKNNRSMLFNVLNDSISIKYSIHNDSIYFTNKRAIKFNVEDLNYKNIHSKFLNFFDAQNAVFDLYILNEKISSIIIKDGRFHEGVDIRKSTEKNNSYNMVFYEPKHEPIYIEDIKLENLKEEIYKILSRE